MSHYGIASDCASRLVTIAAGTVALRGELALPPNAAGIVLFAHGSGSSRSSPRNLYVARTLHEAGIGTLLFDLLMPDEDRRYETRFDIALLGSRLIMAIEWVTRDRAVADLALGCFGASTGAAAALAVAARPDAQVRAVVSRGGRPDLAGDDVLRRVRAPTLLIVGGRDTEVLALNRRSYESLACEKALQVVTGATHLFEERGALEQVAAHARHWFRRWLARPPVAHY